MTVLVLMILAFLALSGIVAAVDAALLSVTRPEIEELIQSQRWGAKRLLEVKVSLARSVVVIVIVTNTINVLGPILVSHQAFEVLDSAGVVGVTIVLTLGSIVFSEILPKAVGAHRAPLVARLSAPPLLVGRKLLWPLVVPLAWLSDWLTRGDRDIGTEPQIRSLVRIGHEAGLIASAEESLIHRVFVLNDRSAADIMTPLREVRAVAETSTISQAAAEVSRSEFSRYPVFGDSLDDICGVVLSRDLLHAVVRGEGADSLMSIARSPLIVDAETRSDDLLALFRDERIHLAVVQQNHRTIGLVSLEDVMEQLVGEIDDEKDATK